MLPKVCYSSAQGSAQADERLAAWSCISEKSHISWPVSITDPVISVSDCSCCLALFSHAWRGAVCELTANLDGCLLSSIIWISYNGRKSSVCLPQMDTVSTDTSMLLLHFILRSHGPWLKIICFPLILWSQSALSPLFAYWKRNSALNVIVTCVRRDTSVHWTMEMADRWLLNNVLLPSC